MERGLSRKRTISLETIRETWIHVVGGRNEYLASGMDELKLDQLKRGSFLGLRTF